MSPHIHQITKFMQVTETKYTDTNFKGFMAVFIFKSVELKESCLKKQALTLYKVKKLKYLCFRKLTGCISQNISQV